MAIGNTSHKVACELNVCGGCTLQCDDVLFLVENRVVKESANVCERGLQWVQDSLQFEVSCQVDCREANVDVAIEAMAKLLGSAQRPAIAGLNQLGLLDQQLAVRLAKQLRAAIDTGLDSKLSTHLMALQNCGRVTATFGEIRDRSDLILFWFGEPLKTHPRIVERLCRSEAKVVFVGDQKVDCSAIGAAARYVELQTADVARFLATCRLKLSGSNPMDAERQVFSPSSAPEKQASFTQLMQEIIAAEHLSVICDMRSGVQLPGSKQVVADVISLYELIRLKNNTARASLLPLRHDFNGLSAENVLAAESGFATAVDFSTGFARSHWQDYSVETLLSQGEVDVCLWITNEADKLSVWQHAAPQTRWIVWNTGPINSTENVNISISVQALGIDRSGDIARNDDVLLPIDSVVDSNRCSPATLLEQLLARFCPSKREECEL